MTALLDAIDAVPPLTAGQVALVIVPLLMSLLITVCAVAFSRRK